MGEVYRGRDTRLDRPVAIKVTRAEFNDRFQREARAISALNHPHICTLYDVGDQHGTPYLVMDLLAGQTLADRYDALPRLFNTPEIRITCPDERKFQVVSEVRERLAAAGYRTSCRRESTRGGRDISSVRN